MGMPSNDELKVALETAAKMREEDKDPNFLAKSLLNLNYRMTLMHDLLHATKLYLRSGEGSTEHTKLLRTIEKIERAEVQSTDNLSAFEPD
ncbi:hypothetical protein [Pleionea sediminis]|uniref:hypothetical protein n=1 Tax=Pleionea sediminis TaxID=2569479 RepID=UPI00118596F6|nr:hypothetical protein [Pleionea sediminis]